MEMRWLAAALVAASFAGCGSDPAEAESERGGGSVRCSDPFAVEGCSADGEPLAPGSGDELLTLLDGRWQRCGGASLPAGADGIEFRPGGFWQFLRELDDGTLIGNQEIAGWQTNVADGACGHVLTLVKQTGGSVVAEARIYEGSPRRLRLDFVEDGVTSNAWFVSVH